MQREADHLPSTPERSNPNLIRIIPTEISTERPKQPSPSWFSSSSQGVETVKTNNPSNTCPVVVAKVMAPTAINQTPVSIAERQLENSNSNSFSASPSLTQSVSQPAQNLSGASHSRDSSGANYVKPDVLETVIEEAAFSSDAEMAKYLDNPLTAAGLSSNYQLESEEFLKSLPPIKPINLDAYATAPLLPPAPLKTVERNRKSHAKNQEKSSATKPSSSQQTNSSPKSKSIEPVNKAVLEPQISVPNLTLSSHQHGADNSSDSSQKNTKVAVSSDAGSEAAVRYKKQVEEILKEKAKLQGQVEILTEESQNVLQVSEACSMCPCSVFFVQ